MKLQVTGTLLALFALASVSFAQQPNPRYSEYWQSYSNVERTYPSGYASDVIEPGWAKAQYRQVSQIETVPYHSRDCESPYPAPGVWDRHNSTNSSYAHWGENNEPYSCERFLTKPCAPAGACGDRAAAAYTSVTFASGNASDLYVINSALIDELKALYCLPAHIIYRLKSRNDAAYNRSHVGGSPSMPGATMERTTLAGINGELVGLRQTCVNGNVR